MKKKVEREEDLALEKRIQGSLTRTCPSDLNYENEEDKKEEYQLTSSSPSHYLSIREAMPAMSGDKGS